MKIPEFDPIARAEKRVTQLIAKLETDQILLANAELEFQDILSEEAPDEKFIVKARTALSGLVKQIDETKLALQGAQRRVQSARHAVSATKKKAGWSDTKKLLRERVVAADQLRHHADGMVSALRKVQALGSQILAAAPIEPNAWNGTQELFYADRTAASLKLYLSAQGADCGMHIVPVLNAPAVRDPAFEVKELAEFILGLQEKDADSTSLTPVAIAK